MAIPDFQSLMLPVLKAVGESGPVSAPDVRARVAEQLGLTASDLAELLPSGRQSTFANRIAWANIFMQRAGLIKVVRRGIYELTAEGASVLGNRPSRIDMKFLESFPSYVEWRKRSLRCDDEDVGGSGPADGPQETISTNPEEQIEQSHKELTATVEADLLDRLRAVTPAQF